MDQHHTRLDFPQRAYDRVRVEGQQPSVVRNTTCLALRLTFRMNAEVDSIAT
jgi:hypothetical protein